MKKKVEKKPVKKAGKKDGLKEAINQIKALKGDRAAIMNAPAKHAGGRPKTTVEERIEKLKVSFDTVFEIVKHGVTDVELARILGVDRDTVHRWKKDSPEFLRLLKEGKDYADAMVEHSLYKRATGYTYDSVEIKVVSLGNNQGSEVQEIPVKIHHPPDVTAQIFWLKNRKKKEWRDKIDHEHGGKDGGPIKTESSVSMTVKEFEKIARKLRDEV